MLAYEGHSDQIVTKCALNAQNDPKSEIGRALPAHAQFARKMANFPRKVGLFHTKYQKTDFQSINFEVKFIRLLYFVLRFTES